MRLRRQDDMQIVLRLRMAFVKKQFRFRELLIHEIFICSERKAQLTFTFHHYPSAKLMRRPIGHLNPFYFK